MFSGMIGNGRKRRAFLMLTNIKVTQNMSIIIYLLRLNHSYLSLSVQKIINSCSKDMSIKILTTFFPFLGQ